MEMRNCRGSLLMMRFAPDEIQNRSRKAWWIAAEPLCDSAFYLGGEQRRLFGRLQPARVDPAIDMGADVCFPCLHQQTISLGSRWKLCGLCAQLLGPSAQALFKGALIIAAATAVAFSHQHLPRYTYKGSLAGSGIGTINAS